MPKTPMTKRGAELLRDELHRLKTVERPATWSRRSPRRARTATCPRTPSTTRRASAQGFIEGRIAELEAKLANAQIIDPKLVDADGRCVFGATVEVEDEGGESATWQIVGEDEADIKAGRISISSPIARALIGKEAGEIGRGADPRRRQALRDPRRPLRVVRAGARPAPPLSSFSATPVRPRASAALASQSSFLAASA